MTLGTLNSRSPPRSGALPNASSTGSDGRGSSSRMTGAEVTGWVVAATPAVSMRFSRSKYARMSPSWRVNCSASRIGQLEMGEARDAVDVGPRQGVGHGGKW